MTKYGQPFSVMPGVEHLRDARVVHDRERLALHVEPGDDEIGVVRTVRGP
jgi:hypothetical protein